MEEFENIPEILERKKSTYKQKYFSKNPHNFFKRAPAVPVVEKRLNTTAIQKKMPLKSARTKLEESKTSFTN